MFIDITVEFKALVKDLTSRSEELGLVIPVKEKTRILGSGDSLPRQAEIIVKTVTSLSELLQQNKDAYLENLAVPGATSAMSDADRNQVFVTLKRAEAYLCTFREQPVSEGIQICIRTLYFNKKNCDINEWAGSAVKRKPNDIIIQIDAGADNIAKQCRSLIFKYQDELLKMTMADSAKVVF